jgi:hypothetical protein
MRSPLPLAHVAVALAIALTLTPVTEAHAVPPDVLWAIGAGGTTDDVVSGVAVDNDGTSYITGFFSGTIDLGGGPLAGNAIDVFVAKFDPDGNHLWSFAMGGDGDDRGMDCAVYPGGGVAVTGFFDSLIATFGGDDFINLGGDDVFVARYDTDGGHVWSRAGGGTTEEQALGVATSSFGQVVITGYFTGTAGFGMGSLVSLGDNDVFIARYDSLGAPDGSVSAGGDSSDVATDVAVDANGNIAVVGQFEGTADFGSGPHASQGDDDIFVMVIDGVDGAGIWSRAGGSAGQDFGNGVAVDGSDNVLITGSFTGTVDFGGGPIASNGGADAFIVKLDEDGDFGWARSFGGLLDDQANGIAVDPANGVVVAGAYQSATIDFPGDTLVNGGLSDLFLAEYTAAGDYVTAAGEGGVGFDFATDVDVTGLEPIFVSGAFQGNMTAGTIPLSSAGGLDGLLIRYGPTFVGVPGGDQASPYVAFDHAWPNPFRSGVTIGFSYDSVPRAHAVEIVDVSGRVVRALRATLGAQSGTAAWDGRDARGHEVAPGVYFVRVAVDGITTARRLTLVK